MAKTKVGAAGNRVVKKAPAKKAAAGKAGAKSAKAEKAAKSPTKTRATAVRVEDFIAAVENETRRQDALVLLSLFEKATGWTARMWGPSIVGFGRYDYVYDSGHGGPMCVAGFSPRKANLVLYLAPDTKGKTAALLARLGKHKGGLDSCLYINKLADVDLDVLRDLIVHGAETMKKTAAEKGWPVSDG